MYKYLLEEASAIMYGKTQSLTYSYASKSIEIEKKENKNNGYNE